jgi:predicted nucleotidyltransferase
MTHADPDELAKGGAIEFACRLAKQWREALGIDLLGAYLIGSLAHGGFSARYSDIDLALITRAGLSPQALDRLRSDAVALSADWGPKVSVFWADRHFSVGRFPPLDRVDYLDHAVALMDGEAVRPARPTLEEIRHYLRGAPFATWAERARSFATAQALAPEDHKPYLRTLLYPGRFCYSWITGLIGSNDDTVAFLHEGQVAGLNIGLLENALRCRQNAADPDALFSARSVLPSQIDACAALVSDECSARTVS